MGVNRSYELMFPLDFAGTLCARDGIKTGPGTPNGEDAYDRKLVVMKRICMKTYVHDPSNCIVKESDVAMTMGSERNRNASNNNPLVLTGAPHGGGRRVVKTYVRPDNDRFIQSESAITLGASVNMSPINNRCVVCSVEKTPVVSGAVSGGSAPSGVVRADGIDPLGKKYGLDLYEQCAKTITCGHGRNCCSVYSARKRVVGRNGGGR